MTTEEMIQHLESVLETLRAKPVTATPEPDPWPTEDQRLIAATPNPDDGTPGRWLMYRSNDGTYWDTEGAQFDPEQGDTLANVVPVTVVPTAELADTWRMLDVWMKGSGAAHAVALSVARLWDGTTALGLDT